MTPEQLQQLRERFPVGSINTLPADEVHELLAHIATLESELQQVRVERDGMREALGPAQPPHCESAMGTVNGVSFHCNAEPGHTGNHTFTQTMPWQAAQPIAPNRDSNWLNELPTEPTTVVHVPIPEGNESRYVEVLREQSQATQPVAEPSIEVNPALGICRHSQSLHIEGIDCTEFHTVEIPPPSSGLSVEEIAEIVITEALSQQAGRAVASPLEPSDMELRAKEFYLAVNEGGNGEDDITLKHDEMFEWMAAFAQEVCTVQFKAGDTQPVASPGAEEIAQRAATNCESFVHGNSDGYWLNKEAAAIVIGVAIRDYAASLEARLGEAQRDHGRAKRCIQEAYWANNQADIGVPKGEEFWANWQEDAAEILHGEPANENTVIRLNLKLTEAEARAEAAEANAAELQGTFDLMWAADQRAIKQWQAATGKDSVWPDRAALTTWLLERVEAAEARNKELEQAPRFNEKKHIERMVAAGCAIDFDPTTLDLIVTNERADSLSLLLREVGETLTKQEWRESGFIVAFICPACGFERPTHHKNCWLSALLTRLSSQSETKEQQ